MIKAIETHYNGNRFRSRLEARWAVCFDEWGVKYRYEPEGFDLGGGIWYLPDFEVPGWGGYVEIKPMWPPTKQECEKAVKLCKGTGKNVYILAGNPGPDEYQMIEYSTLAPIKRSWNTYGTDLYPPGKISTYFHLRSQGEAMMFGESKEYDSPFFIGTYNFNLGVTALNAVFAVCRRCQTIWPGTYWSEECRTCGARHKHTFDFEGDDGFRLFHGFYRAYQARFEHGEKP